MEVEQDKLDFSKGSTSDSGKDLDVDLQSLNTSVLSTEIRLLNLDVSALLAYVTNMANGYNNYVYREPLLTQQAEMEKKRPIKPILENLFRDKDLIICRTAYNNFMSIIDVIGGPNETQRAQELLKKVRIVDDVTTGRIMELRLGGKIKDRSRLIFATGESMKSITVSANEGFVRAARMQVNIFSIYKIVLLSVLHHNEQYYRYFIFFRALNVQFSYTNHDLYQKLKKVMQQA